MYGHKIPVRIAPKPVTARPSVNVEFSSNLRHEDRFSSPSNIFYEEHSYSRIKEIFSNHNNHELTQTEKVLNTNSRPGPALQRPINVLTHNPDDPEFQEYKRAWLSKYFGYTICVNHENYILHEDETLLKNGDLFETSESIRTPVSAEIPPGEQIFKRGRKPHQMEVDKTIKKIKKKIASSGQRADSLMVMMI
ncbi:uncharacterized protein ACR2FA_012202 [Aphomia sociella]